MLFYPTLQLSFFAFELEICFSLLGAATPLPQMPLKRKTNKKKYPYI